MNFISDVLEQFPSAKPALLAIDANGERRVWHFGELIAMSAGVSGALAARGVGRGDVVMTLAGNRVEWVLTMLAAWRMGAVALPMSTQLRPGDLVHRVAVANPKLCVGEEELLGSIPGGVECMAMADMEAVLDEDRPQETPASIADLDPERSCPDRLHFWHDRRAARGAPHRLLPAGAAWASGELGRLGQGRSGLGHHRDRLV